MNKQQQQQRRCHAECSRDDYRVLHMNLTLRGGRSDRLKSLDAGYTLNDLLDELHQAVVSGPDSGARHCRQKKNEQCELWKPVARAADWRVGW